MLWEQTLLCKSKYVKNCVFGPWGLQSNQCTLMSSEFLCVIAKPPTSKILQIYPTKLHNCFPGLVLKIMSSIVRVLFVISLYNYKVTCTINRWGSESPLSC